MTDSISFPRQSALTRRYTLGAPRSFSVSADGARVVFLRSAGGRDSSTGLWVLDVATGAEREVAAASALLAGAAPTLSAEERAQRERLRESADGITSYSLDVSGRRATFSLAGRLFVADLITSTTTELAATGAVFDPRLSPDGSAVAYCSAGGLRISSSDGDRGLVSELDVSWGLAEFVAAEEMGRFRGHWWSPDGTSLLVARVDERPVRQWWISDPANPDREPVSQRYPAAGTPNADVSLWLLGLDGTRIEVTWARDEYEYLAGVAWPSTGGPLILVQSRDQRTLQWLSIDCATGATTVRQQARDKHWLELVDGTPAVTGSGRLLSVLPDGNSNRLHVDGVPVTPDGLQVAAVLSVDGEAALLSATEEPTESHLYLWDASTTRRLTKVAGVHSGRLGGGTLVVSSTTLASPGSATAVWRAGDSVADIASFAEQPVITAAPALLRLGTSTLPAALLLPTGWVAGSGTLPVLVDPYGGPHSQRVMAAHNAHLSSQWFADQGFAVLVADGRGTPARGPSGSARSWGAGATRCSRTR